MRGLGVMIGAAAAGWLVVAGGCQLIAGVEDAVPYPDAGTGSGGQGGGTTCEPGTMVPCRYTGPEGTERNGICHAGEQLCAANGMGDGACSGEVVPKAESCAAAEDENCDGYDCVQWAQLFGDGADQRAWALAVDAKGNSYVVGSFAGAISINGESIKDAGSSDAFVLKVDASGKPVWGKRFGDASFQSAYSVAVDSLGDILVGGWSDSQTSFGGPTVAAGLFALKLSSDGQHMWSKGLGSMGCGTPSGKIASITATSTNDFIVGGSFCGTIDFGDGTITSQGGEDAFIVKFRGGDGSAKIADKSWVRTFGDSDLQNITSLTLDPQGGVIAVGYFAGTIVTLNHILTSKDASPDMFYIRLSPDGSDLWASSYGDTGTQAALGVNVDNSGNIIIVGNFSTPFTIQGHAITGSMFSNSTFVVKLNSADAYQWSKVLQADMNSAIVATSLSNDKDNNLILAGFFDGKIDFGVGAFDASGAKMNVFLAKLTPAGQPVWSKYLINQTSNNLIPIGALTPSGEPLLSGFSTGSIDFGTGLLTPIGASDIFLAKFSP